MLHDEVLTQDDLRQAEARLNAPFQTINARFIAVDGRFATLIARINEIEQDLQELERRSETRCRAIERRIEVTRAQTDDVRIQIAMRIDETRRALAQVVLLGLLGTVVCTGLLCGLTILLVI